MRYTSPRFPPSLRYEAAEIAAIKVVSGARGGRLGVRDGVLDLVGEAIGTSSPNGCVFWIPGLRPE